MRARKRSASIPRPSRHVVAATNELIHPAVARLFSRFLAQFDPELVRHYANHEHAVGRVARYLGTTPAQVLLTAGSDAAIQMVLTAGTREQPPNYRGYEAFARLAGLAVHRVDTFRLSTQACEEALSRALAHLPPALVVITNRSGVDGSLLNLEAVERLARLAASCGHAMVLDDARIFGFGTTPLLPQSHYSAFVFEDGRACWPAATSGSTASSRKTAAPSPRARSSTVARSSPSSGKPC
jgi:histidinol-phosphate/aromatic aminotransferase/cobyric acid decarboxylase-like protein